MAQRQPIKPGDLFRFRPLSDLQVSPDGTQVVYVVQEHDLEKDKVRSAIWMVAAAGGTPRRLTNPVEGSDRAPRWAPDGSAIAFLSDRSGKPQLWVIPAGGGEARRIETKQKPTGEPLWSPDTKQIAFTAHVFDKPQEWTPYPGAPESDRKRAEEAANYEPPANGNGAGGDQKPSDVKVISRLHFRMDGAGYFGDKRSQIFIVPADGGGEARQLTGGDFDHQAPCWAPDGQAIICSAVRTEGDADFFFRSDLWRFDLATGEATLLYGCAGPALEPKVSPDGRYIAFAGHEAEHLGSTTFQLMLLDLHGAPGARAVSLTREIDRIIGAGAMSDIGGGGRSYQWAADSRSLYCLIADRGDSHLFRLPVDGAAPIQLTGGEERSVSDFAVADDATVAMLVRDSVTPDELYLLVDGEERRLTDHNLKVAADLDFVKPERFSFIGADNWPVEGWLLKPAGYEPGKRYPTVLSIHGGPHGLFGSGAMIMWQQLAAAGMAVVYINPRGSESYGQQFALAVVKDWGGKDYQDLMLGIDHVIAMGVADPERLGVMGWSYGGYMTAWTITQTDRFKAAITGAPVVDNYSMIGTTDIPWFTQEHTGGNPWEEGGAEKLLARSPIRHAGRVTTPTMIVSGEADLRCPVAQAEELYLALKRIGKAPVVHIRYPGEFHGLAKPKHRADRYERMLAWFSHYLCRA